MQQIIMTKGHLGEDTAEGVLDAIMRNQDASCVIQEMVEVEEVHWVVLKSRRKRPKRSWDGDGDWFLVVATLAMRRICAVQPESKFYRGARTVSLTNGVPIIQTRGRKCRRKAIQRYRIIVFRQV